MADPSSIVKEARRMKNVKIVSFDWLEDSLLKRRVQNERQYAMSVATRIEADTKSKKKAVRKANILKGSMYSAASM